MRRRRRVILIGSLLILIAAWWGGVFADWIAPQLSLAANAPPDSGRLTVGKTVHVSAARPDAAHYGCTLAADPVHPNRLFAASMPTLGGKSFAVIGYYSHDGGETWPLGCERVGRTPDERCGDEALAFGPDGDLVLAHMRGNYGRTTPGARPTGQVDVIGSGDGGRTWAERGVLDPAVDRPQLAFDLTDGPHRGRLYCNANAERPGTVLDGAVLGKMAGVAYASSDGGRTLTAAVLPDPDVYTNTGNSNPVVLADGTVVVAYHFISPPARDPRRIVVWRSTDGGRTFADAGRVPTKWRHTSLRAQEMLRSKAPRLAAAPAGAAETGRLYCVWDDGPLVLFSTSDDRGGTWTKPTLLSEQPIDTGPDERYYSGMPAIAVNRRGEIAVAWYDRRGLPPETVDAEGVVRTRGYNLRLRASRDGGRTWLASVPINDQPGRGDPFEVRFWGLAMEADADGRFHPTWVSDSGGVQQLWTTAVTLDAPR